MAMYGYVRVSSKDPNESRQVIALSDFGVPPENIFRDKQSGKDFNRPGYLKMVNTLQPGDLVCIESLDRLGRDYQDIQNEWRKLVHEMGVDILVLDMPILDTRKGKDLLGTFLSDIVLQVLSFVAENERRNIRERQEEGIQAAKSRGVRFGRPCKPLSSDFYKAARRYQKGELTCQQAADTCSMTESTFRRNVKKMDNG